MRYSEGAETLSALTGQIVELEAERDRLRDALEEIMQRTRQESGSAAAAHHIARRALTESALSPVESDDQVGRFHA